MTREKAKELLSIIQAYAEGKTVQWYSINQDTWVDCQEGIGFFDNVDYRIKPETKLRPYTFEEMREAVKKHGNMVCCLEGSCWTITYFGEHIITFHSSDGEPMTYKELMENNVWLDDNTPCGCIIEE